MDDERSALLRVALRIGIKVDEGWTSAQISVAIADKDAHGLRVDALLRREWYRKLRELEEK